jgi:hypothetical protein
MPITKTSLLSFFIFGLLLSNISYATIFITNFVLNNKGKTEFSQGIERSGRGRYSKVVSDYRPTGVILRCQEWGSSFGIYSIRQYSQFYNIMRIESVLNSEIRNLGFQQVSRFTNWENE